MHRHCPGKQKEDLDVEHQEGDRHQMEADGEAAPRVVHRGNVMADRTARILFYW